MLFSVPNDAIQSILPYIADFFDSVKVFVFLSLGISLALLIIGFAITIIPQFSYKSRVKHEARRRMAEMEEEEEEEMFEEDVGEAIDEVLFGEE